jgi:hypothetical protein
LVSRWTGHMIRKPSRAVMDDTVVTDQPAACIWLEIPVHHKPYEGAQALAQSDKTEP